jgi:hypothetical protein
MPLRQRRCHTPNCPNYFLSTNNYRRFCDSCRVARNERYAKSPKERKRNRDYQKLYYERHLDSLRAYKADWMKRKRAGLPTAGVNPRLRPQEAVPEAVGRYKECFKCAYQMNKE